jgi:D-glycero-alpha-D-manno-heptose-7-phosphate kinase
VNYWEFSKNGSIRRVPINKNKVKHLQDRLILVFTGEGHLSASVHEKVFEGRRFIKFVPQIDRMRVIAKKMLYSLSDEQEMAKLINETWELQKSLHKLMETQSMKLIQEACKGYYLAARATGAGGGGCMLFYAKPELKSTLIKRIKKVDGKIKNLKIIPFEFDYKGIELEED